MFRILAITAVLSLMVSCTSARYYPEYEKSNQVMLEEALQTLNLGSLITNRIPVGSKVVVRSIELNSTIDARLTSLIEDKLISSLIQAGYKVQERDENALGHIIREGYGDAYSMSYQLPLVVDTTNLEPVLLKDTRLQGAQFVLSYRILEAGVLYKRKDPDYFIREAMVRMHVRIEDAQTGEIVMANHVSQKSEDMVRAQFVDQYADYHYTFFGHENPIQGESPTTSATNLGGVTDDYFYLTYGLGMHHEYKNNGMGSGISFGYGMEAGRIDIQAQGGGFYSTQNLMVTLSKPISLNERQRLMVLPRFGIGYITDSQFKETKNDVTYADVKSGLGLGLGLGVDYKINASLHALATYDLHVLPGEIGASNGNMNVSLMYTWSAP